ncbi:hypothetical protein E4U43_002898 [Claviceps pusilla]|uniref:Copper transport protein n=1 Tax=Claviceps pusilla TaxID=123648 RepID=A0A9P7N5I9_9HYPO|nr:hypothetical protein E4U43_002898 [Claviceps pusilla]
MDMNNHGDAQDGAACKISMLWNWYTIDACFLTSSWHITNNAMFAATCIGVILLVTFVEFTRRLGKEYDAFLLRQFQREATRRTYRDGTSSSSSEDNSATFPSSSSSSHVVKFRASLLQQLMRAVLHALTFGTAYMVMLLAMYFNGFVIICIFIGAGVGKFFCDWLEVRIGVGEGYGGQGKVVGGMGGGIQDPSVCCG